MLWWLRSSAKVCNLCMTEKESTSFNGTGLDDFECGGHPDTNVCKTCMEAWKDERRSSEHTINCPICRREPSQYLDIMHALLGKPMRTS